MTAATIAGPPRRRPKPMTPINETLSLWTIASREWTADPGTLPWLRAVAAADAKRVGGEPRERTMALLAVAHFDGKLLPPTQTADCRCERCGGYLARLRGNQWIHVDTCIEELEGDPCPDNRTTHQVCETPWPVICVHASCHAAGDLTAVPCEYGYDACCGTCCHGEEQARRG